MAPPTAIVPPRNFGDSPFRVEFSTEAKNRAHLVLSAKVFQVQTFGVRVIGWCQEEESQSMSGGEGWWGGGGGGGGCLWAALAGRPRPKPRENAPKQPDVAGEKVRGESEREEREIL